MKSGEGDIAKEKKGAGLRSIPGVGKAIEKDLISLGITNPGDLMGKDPEKLYLRLCALQGRDVDRCMLYVLRCAIYFVTEQKHDAELLKWWNWKDGQTGALAKKRGARYKPPPDKKYL
ncbi:MAG: helix-hairpin-helix domain-containing protein [Nitrospinota bacterium]|nr:helix-hairpin-helix domain-containing protein [Nitrospinota bacterium]